MKSTILSTLAAVLLAACSPLPTDYQELRSGDGDEIPTTSAGTDDTYTPDEISDMDAKTELAYPACGAPGSCDELCMTVLSTLPIGYPKPSTKHNQCTTTCTVGDPTSCASSPTYAAICAPYTNLYPGVCAIDCSVSPCPSGMQCIPYANKTMEICAWPK